MKLHYDQASPDSILIFSQEIIGHTLREYITDDELKSIKFHRGDIGQAIEKFYFQIQPGSSKEPDFPKAGVELKTTGAKIVKNEYRAKERLVLGSINFNDVVNESFNNSSLMNKVSLMLLMIYLYSKDLTYLDYKFLDTFLYSFPKKDLMIIEKDWEKIVQKVRDGKAHEISEGDTMYLGACTKGKNSKDVVNQPFSKEKAMKRAFSLKQGYLNTILDKHLDSDSVVEEIDLSSGKTVEDVVLEKLNRFRGKSVEEIAKELDVNIDTKAKNYYSRLTMAMLGSKKSSAEELVKSDVIVKTIRLKSNGTPKEAISFPYFKYREIVKEEWVSSKFRERLERRFLFVVLKYDENGNLFFNKAVFWNVPYKDMIEAKRVWGETIKRIKANRANLLPKSSESYAFHVRPHAKNKLDTNEDLYGNNLVKKCFWFNIDYIKNIIFK